LRGGTRGKGADNTGEAAGTSTHVGLFWLRPELKLELGLQWVL